MSTDESMPLAEKTAKEYGLSIVGFYGSADFDVQCCRQLRRSG